MAGALAACCAEATKLALTQEETAWIAAHPVVRVGFSPSYPPYSFPDAKGEMHGIDLDYLALIGQRTGLRFEPVVHADWPAAEAAFAAGDVDLLTLLVGSPRQAQEMLLSRSYLSVPRVVVSRDDSPYILRAADVRGLRLANVRGYTPLAGPTWELLQQGTLIEYPNAADAMSALAKGEVDAVLSDALNAAYTIRSLHLGNLRLGSVIDTPLDLYFGARRDAPLLRAILDKAIADFTPQDRRRIDERWVSVDMAPSRWLLAFKVAAALVVLILLVAVALFLHERRIFRELAARRRMQAELEAAHAQLALISEQKTALLRMVAHDFRSPLTSMLLASDLAASAGPGDYEFTRGLVRQFHASTRQLQRLVCDLLDAQAGEDGRRLFAREPVELNALIAETTALHAAAAATKRLQLHTQPAPQEVVIESDPVAVRQIVDNLLSNALKFSRAGTAVTVRVISGAAGARIEIADQGPGIGADERARLFQRYERGSALPTGGERSSGLGLWIVASVVRGLHGSVHCTSAPGTGSIFIVELPWCRPAQGESLKPAAA